MQKNDIKIKLITSARKVVTVPEYSIKLDGHLLKTVSSDEQHTFLIVQSLDPGPHRLSVEFFNKNFSEIDPPNRDMAVIVESVKFQNLSSEFNVYSQYQPVYPDDWSGPRTPVIHANYLGWNGEWYIDFEAPIYQWIHQRLNLGWLI